MEFGSQDKVLKFLDYDDDPYLQAEALIVLGKQGNVGSSDRIMELTDNEEAILQRGAVSALSGISRRILRPEGRTEIVRKLIEVYQREKKIETAKNDGNSIVVLEKIGEIFTKKTRPFYWLS